MREEIRFANYLAKNMDGVYEGIAAEVCRVLKRPYHYTPADTSENYDVDVVDVAFLCGWPYTIMTQASPPPIELLAAPVLNGEKYAGRPVYFSDIMVRADSDYHTVEDLKGCRFAYNDIISYSGHRVVQHYLQQHGLDWDFFGELICAGSHQNGIKMVFAGEADAAAIDTQVFKRALIEEPRLKTETRVLDSIGPSPMPPIVAATRLDEETKEAMRQALANLHHSEEMRQLLQTGSIEHFKIVTDKDYDPIREVVR